MQSKPRITEVNLVPSYVARNIRNSVSVRMSQNVQAVERGANDSIGNRIVNGLTSWVRRDSNQRQNW